MNTKRTAKYLMAVVAGSLIMGSAAFADEEFYGRIDSRPEGNAGIWIVSGQQVEVTDKTKIDSDNGPLVVGSCVEVEHKKGVVKEIETSKPSKCGK
jgi:uncharacterized protein DUF5666